MPRTATVRKPKAAPAAAPVTITLPALEKGEALGGILFKDGKPLHHVIILPGDTSGTWDEMMKSAKKQGGELPTRKEQALLFACAPEHFKPDWYWSGEARASDAEYAWDQYFSNGGQNYWPKSDKYRARAVRRVPI